eukprot:8817352-Pyramimonas_sp.AAC.1
MLNFGSLQEVLRPRARYLVPDPDDPAQRKYRAVSWDEFRRRFPRSRPSKGLLEVLATEFEFLTLRVSPPAHPETEPHGGLLAPLGGLLGPSRAPLGASWGLLGASWRPL